MITNIIKGLLKIASCVYYKLFESPAGFSEDSGITLLGKLFVPLVIVYVVYASKNNGRRRTRCGSNESLDTDTDMTDLEEMGASNNELSHSNLFMSNISSSTLASPARQPFLSQSPTGLKTILRRSKTPFSVVHSSLGDQTANTLCNMDNTNATLVSTGSDSDFQSLPQVDTYRIRESRAAITVASNHDNSSENNPRVTGFSTNDEPNAPANLAAASSLSNRIPQRRRNKSFSNTRNQSPASSRRKKRN